MDAELLRDRLRDAELLDKLAEIEHERWSHWQRYLHSQCEHAPDGSLVLPSTLVDRWTRQMDAPFADLTDAEKNSDREQVLRYLPVIEDALTAES
jgi:hypothetical protein